MNNINAESKIRIQHKARSNFYLLQFPDQIFVKAKTPCSPMM